MGLAPSKVFEGWTGVAHVLFGFACSALWKLSWPLALAIETSVAGFRASEVQVFYLDPPLELSSGGRRHFFLVY